MSDEKQAAPEQLADALDEAAAILNSVVIDSEVRVRNAAKREIEARIAPFEQVINTITGPEVIARGAFKGVEPSKVLLMGLEHEVHLGLGQDGRVIPTRRPTGKAIEIEEREDGAYGVFRVAKTATGDEILALVEDGVVGGVSVEMGRDARTRIETRNGRRTSVVEFADLKAVSPTYQPAYADARVLAVRSQKEDAPVATEEKAPDAGATTTEDKPEEQVQVRTSFDASAALGNFEQGLTKITEVFGERLEKLEERARSSFEIPGAPKETPKASLGVWMDTAVRLLTGERIADTQYRTVADLITTDNAGIVPDAYVDRLIGVIDPSRPFMASTERLPTPSSGMNMVVPKITQRPTVDKQSAEKAELASQETTITTESFGVATYGGVGDISIQLLKRSDPSFLELYLRLLAEAYAIETEDAAVAALITAINDGGPEPATALDPEDLSLGAAYQNSFDAMRQPPDTIWLSSGAVAAFINAKSDGANAPLYSNLSANFTAGGGAGGTIQGLRPVHVPALDGKGAYAIVGRRNAFAWAEDGTYTLQVDVPSKAGRDVALVGMVWFVPWYPEAFTLFNVAS
jgi:HK97 family phage prohead protease/HK97 family phage major capsid protein